MKGTAQRRTQHKMFVPYDTYPNPSLTLRTSFMLKLLYAITRLRRSLKEMLSLKFCALSEAKGMVIKMKTNKSIFNYVDCIRIFIPDLEKGLEYYHHKLGLQIAWKTDNAIGLLMNDG